MTYARIARILDGTHAVGSQVEVRGWVRKRRDSKSGLSFVNVSVGT
jgi:asparaginyl-tRNA synthetase